MSQAAPAQSWFERLVMPGDLIRGHAKLEKDCSNCHLSFSQGAQSGLCRDCHKEAAKNLDDGTGFHGRAPEMRGQECRHCHTDHIGRDLPALPFHHSADWRQTRPFDHSKTAFSLKGAHDKAACKACHAPSEPASAAPTACIGCHRGDDPHKGKLGESCDTCHSPGDWLREVAFDHDITRFPLIGQHVLVPCEECHPDATYRGTEVDCAACHGRDDVHRGAFGKGCDQCHGTSSIKGARLKLRKP
ncbi:hypothetical protein ACFOHS_19300 [Jhaorihella thermophila]